MLWQRWIRARRVADHRRRRAGRGRGVTSTQSPGAVDELSLRYQADALAPYVVLASHATSRARPASATAAGHLAVAVQRHLDMLQRSTAALPTLQKTRDTHLLRAQERVQADLRSPDPLQRYLARRRLELKRCLSRGMNTPQQLAERTWSEIRQRQELSLAFDRHMVARSTRWLNIHPTRTARPLLVDVGGGAGHYADMLICNLGSRWSACVIDEYKDAGWLAHLGPQRNRISVTRASCLQVLPEGAGIYLLASILHNLDDATSLHLLRLCSRSAASSTQIVVIERTWNPNEFRDSSRDIDMQILFGGKERNDAEFESLFNSAKLRLADKYVTPDSYRVFVVKRR